MLASVDDANLDGGPRTAKPGTARMCALTRQVRPIDELIRFVVAPSGEVAPDLKRKLPGRGLWISASRAALAEAVKRGIFSKGFKRQVRLSPTFADDTERLMVQGAIEALAMAAKARQVVSGFSKVESALRRGEADGPDPRLGRRGRRHPQARRPDRTDGVNAIGRNSGGFSDFNGPDLGRIGFGTRLGQM